jgi:PAS domain-containing protein
MQGWGWEKVHHPDHIQRVLEIVKEGWQRPEPMELTFPLRGKDGQYRLFLTRIYPVLDEEGKICNGSVLIPILMNKSNWKHPWSKKYASGR